MTGFGERLRQARGSDSQASFARKLGISQVAYSRYELEQREPGLDCLYQIGIMTGDSIDWLLGLPERSGGITQQATANGPGGQAVALARGNVVISPGKVEAQDCSTCKYKRLAEVIKATL